jgi:DNA-binding GntR family transcriptional regulator
MKQSGWRGNVLSVYEELRSHILSGDFPPGAPLVEAALAKKLGVSRTPIREALRRLEQDTLIERVHRGLQVRGRSPAEILDEELMDAIFSRDGDRAAAIASEHMTVARDLRLEMWANDPASMPI